VIVSITTHDFCFFLKTGKCGALKTLPIRRCSFRNASMRLSLFSPILLSLSILAGCVSAPNQPTLTLQTAKTPEQYTDCVMPKLQDRALQPTLSQSQRHYRIVLSSSVAADNVLEAYKSSAGGKIFLYERRLLASSFTPSSFERAAQECL